MFSGRPRHGCHLHECILLFASPHEQALHFQHVAMVLEEVANSDGFGEPQSSTDPSEPFATQAPSDVEINIDLSTLPQPFPIIGALAGYGKVARAQRLHKSLQQAQSLLQRPLNQDEALAIAQTYSQVMRTSSWGDAFGLAAGGYQCYRTSGTFRFPFWSPNLEKFTPDKLGPLRGPQARMAWHACRALPYAAMGMFVGDLFFRNYATMQAALGMRKDERLVDFNKALERMMQKKIEDVGERRMRNRPYPEAQQREREGLSRTSPAPPRTRGSGSDDYDDMSPTGGAFVDSYGDKADTGLLSDTQMRANEAQRHDSASYDSRYQRQMQKESTGGFDARDERQPSPQQRNENRGDSFDLGTSSSSSTNGPQQGNLPPWAQNRNASSPSTSSSPARPSGSAWDRLRQQAQGSGSDNSPYPRTQGEQRQGATGGDSFSFSSSDEERQLAKSEAQKDFDRRVERERQGRDFDGREKRW